MLGRAGATLGTRQIGCTLMVLEPGKRAWPYHLHHAEEELFVVLEGEGSVSPAWGNASSAAERLWSTRDAAGLVRDEDFDAESRLEAKLGYGLRAPRGLGAITPYTGLTLSDGGAHTWRGGARWKVSDATSLSLEGTREERSGDEAPSDALMLRAAVRW